MGRWAMIPLFRLHGRCTFHSKVMFLDFIAFIGTIAEPLGLRLRWESLDFRKLVGVPCQSPKKCMGHVGKA